MSKINIFPPKSERLERKIQKRLDEWGVDHPIEEVQECICKRIAALKQKYAGRIETVPFNVTLPADLTARQVEEITDSLQKMTIERFAAFNTRLWEMYQDLDSLIVEICEREYELKQQSPP